MSDTPNPTPSAFPELTEGERILAVNAINSIRMRYTLNGTCKSADALERLLQFHDRALDEIERLNQRLDEYEPRLLSLAETNDV